MGISNLSYLKAKHTIHTIMAMATQQYRETLEKYDADNSGTLDAEEITGMVNTHSKQPFSISDIRSAIAGEFGDDCSEINFEQFCRLVERIEHNTDDIEESFSYFDEDGDGKLTLKELKRGLKKLRKTGGMPKLTKAQIKQMFKDADTDNSGFIDL